MTDVEDLAASWVLILYSQAEALTHSKLLLKMKDQEVDKIWMAGLDGSTALFFF